MLNTVSLAVIECGSIPHSNFADVNVTYDDGEVNVTCDVGYHVTGQSLTSVSQITRCQLDGTLTEPVTCEGEEIYTFYLLRRNTCLPMPFC